MIYKILILSSMPTKDQQKILAMVSCYLSDITLMAWIYFKTTNYGRYAENVKTVVESPNFQTQFYYVFLQSLTFMLLLFFVAQTVVYLLAWRNFRSAYLYLKFFAVFGVVVTLYITVMSSPFAFFPLVIYVAGYYTFARLFKETSAVLQNSPQ